MIYICVPSYNEQQTLGVLLWKIRQVMAEFRRDYQVLVLDDASTDETGAALAPYLRVMPLTVIRHAERQGYAASLERLLREAVRRSAYAKRDAVVVMQADFTDDPAYIQDLVKRIEGGADVVGSVLSFEPGDTTRAFRWTRRFASVMARRFRRWPADVGDPLSGFRAYRVICLRKALGENDGQRLLRAGGWAVNAELLQAVVPEARRRDAVDIPSHYGSRQRPSRLQPRAAVLDFVAFLRNVHGAEGPAPASVEVEEVKARSLIERVAEGGDAVLAEIAAERGLVTGSRPGGGTGKGRRKRRGGRRRSGSSRRGGKKSGRNGGSGPASETTDGRAGRADGAGPAADGAQSDGARGVQGEGTHGAAGEGTGSGGGNRRRRRRRGGRRRGGRGRKGSPQQQSAGEAPGSKTGAG